MSDEINRPPKMCESCQSGDEILIVLEFFNEIFADLFGVLEDQNKSAEQQIKLLEGISQSLTEIKDQLYEHP